MADLEDVRAVIFGWGGNLVDSGDAFVAAYREATMRIIGEQFPVTSGDIELVLGMPTRVSFRMLADDQQTVEALVDLHHQLYLGLAQTHIRPVPGADALLREVRARGMKIGVVTLKPAERVAVDIERCGLAGLIDVMLTDDGSDAVEPEPMRRCLRELCVEPSEAVYVGVRPMEAIAASAAGIERTVLLDPSRTPEQVWQGEGQLRSMTNLMDLIARSREVPTL